MANRVPKEFKDEVEYWDAFWRTAFGLKTWDITLEVDPSVDFDDNEPADAAVTNVVPERKYGTILVSPYAPIETICYLVCHEYLHVVRARSIGQMKSMIEALDTSNALKLQLIRLMTDLEEYDIDAIATSFVSLVKDKKRKK